jgi:hypothetical protein
LGLGAWWASGFCACVLFVATGCDGSEQISTRNRPVEAEVVLVSMAGWTQTADTMKRIEREMVRQLSARLPNHRVKVKRRLLGLLPEGDSELFLALAYEGWKNRKKTAAGSQDQFVAIGHSSGATAIYSLLRNKTFKSGRFAPSFLGLIDMSLPIGPHDLTGYIPDDGSQKTGIVHYHTRRTPRIGGIRNMPVSGDHFSIIRSRAVAQGLARSAANSCVQRAR